MFAKSFYLIHISLHEKCFSYLYPKAKCFIELIDSVGINHSYTFWVKVGNS